jgi:hypothetical protein
LFDIDEEECYTKIISDRRFRRMTLPEILFSLYFAILAAYLSVVLARVLKQNGRVLDKIDGVLERMDKGFNETLEKMDKGFELIAKLIVEEDERTRREILNALAK